jgi:hypothetical protein
MFMNKHIISYVEYLDDHVYLDDERGVALNPSDWTHTLFRYFKCEFIIDKFYRVEKSESNCNSSALVHCFLLHSMGSVLDVLQVYIYIYIYK